MDRLIRTCLGALATVAFIGCSPEPQGAAVAVAAPDVGASPLGSGTALAGQESQAQALPVVADPPTPPFPEGCTSLDLGRDQDLDLVRAVERSDADPKVRYAALRRLEELESPRTVPAALKLLHSEDPFLRSNTIALLARSDDPRAAQAIASLEPRYRRLAAFLRQKKQEESQ